MLNQFIHYALNKSVRCTLFTSRWENEELKLHFVSCILSFDEHRRIQVAILFILTHLGLRRTIRPIQVTRKYWLESQVEYYSLDTRECTKHGIKLTTHEQTHFIQQHIICNNETSGNTDTHTFATERAKVWRHTKVMDEEWILSTPR